MIDLDEVMRRKDLRTVSGGEIKCLFSEIVRLRERLRHYEPEPGKCEHGVTEGDWCEACNMEYKKAREVNGE